MGGCQAASLPGIYYEKVYSKIVIVCFILWFYYSQQK